MKEGLIILGKSILLWKNRSLGKSTRFVNQGAVCKLKTYFQDMKYLYLVCAGLLFLALANLPIGYYTFLRIIVSIGAIVVVVEEWKNGYNFWVISFGIIAVVFNPLIPIYLYKKDSWVIIDAVVAVLFLIKSLTQKNITEEKPR
ncbi:DUF6804 family protein [Dyadobacter tibetensis]|uniref:DUF6804 family protein n=1 Tax=Dyadobacter tibetensis TaxID=1211851 RepID=UPI0004B5E5E5|nr:DUF6804 family protein [Dyadobacter tibetensis]